MNWQDVLDWWDEVLTEAATHFEAGSWDELETVDWSVPEQAPQAELSLAEADRLAELQERAGRLHRDMAESLEETTQAISEGDLRRRAARAYVQADQGTDPAP